MRYTVLNITCPEEYREILIAELDGLGFSSFWEHTAGIQAYFEAGSFERSQLEDLLIRYNWMKGISYTMEEITDHKNWNEEWEKNFQPITVEDQCLVRASFHASSGNYPYEIIINPQMSFGTGHHETTYLMLSQQLELDFRQKKVLDVGCGTGILAIMATKRGAASVLACDIDEWPVENSKANFLLNQCAHIEVYRGTVREISHKGKYDIILANINRNVLLDELSTYTSLLAPGGSLLLSGFYQSDVEILLRKAAEHQLQLKDKRTKNQWAMLWLQSEKIQLKR